jgi:dihydropyrimidinase
MEFLIKGGTIVSAARSQEADVYVKNGLIMALGSGIPRPGDQTGVIDARGCYVLPGGVDVHVHLAYPLKGFRTADDFLTGTVAAAAGGTTTIVNMLPPPGQTSLRASVEKWREEAEKQAVVDYCFHQIINRTDAETSREVKALIRDGFPSFKVFLGTDNAIDDGHLLRLMETLRDNCGQLLVSAGNLAMEAYAAERLKQSGRNRVGHYHLSRPELAEIEGTGRAVRLAALINIPLYLVHVSLFEAFQEIQRGREQGVSITAETCPQYLLLSRENYLFPEEEAVKYTVNPPLRGREQHERLWGVVGEGRIQVVSSDHCPFNARGQKDIGKEDFSVIPNGLPGIETRIPLLFSEGVAKGRITLNRFVDAVATAPARACGLYPQKGCLEVGSDADLVILDPDAPGVASASGLNQQVDYCPYDCFPLSGFPRLTMVRGRIVFADNHLLVEPGYGRFLPRSLP